MQRKTHWYQNLTNNSSLPRAAGFLNSNFKYSLPFCEHINHALSGGYGCMSRQRRQSLLALNGELHEGGEGRNEQQMHKQTNKNKKTPQHKETTTPPEIFLFTKHRSYRVQNIIRLSIDNFILNCVSDYAMQRKH